MKEQTRLRGGEIVRISLALAFVAGVLLTAGCATTRNYADPDSLQQLVSDRAEPYILVDVRTPGEYAGGHIPTAINIPVTSISDAPPAADRNALIIVYCASGNRSAAATHRLQVLGFRRVVDFGGISKWKGPLEKAGT